MITFLALAIVGSIILRFTLLFLKGAAILIGLIGLAAGHKPTAQAAHTVVSHL